jgi:uncharacterized protein (TIGR00369 family)
VSSSAVPTPDQLLALDRLLRLSPHNSFLGMKLESAKDNRISISLPMSEKLIGNESERLIHGGVVSSLLDTSCSLAVMLRLGKLIRVATLDMRLDYLRSARAEGTLYGRSSCYRLTDQMAFVRGTAFTIDDSGNEDKVAKAAATFLVIHQQRVSS